MRSKLIVLSIISIFLIKYSHSYFEEESNFLVAPYDRNNKKVNKGVWFRHKNIDELSGKTRQGHFIFRTNTVDGDGIVSQFESFEDGILQNSPVVSSYVERSKRSSSKKKIRRLGKSVAKSIKNYQTSNSIEKERMMSSKIMTKIRPLTVFNDYPHQVAALLRDIDKNHTDLKKEEDNLVVALDDDTEVGRTETDNHIYQMIVTDSDALSNNAFDDKAELFSKHILKKLNQTFQFNKDANDTDRVLEKYKVNRDVHEQWRRPFPESELEVNKISQYTLNSVPYKFEANIGKPVKPVTERGLIKVLSMLTKTFKKIIKQHEDIKSIHNNISGMNSDLDLKLDRLNKKFEEFDMKFKNLNEYDENLKQFFTKLTEKENMCNEKEKELSKNLIEFENQQKKFLAQQKQFFSIQKMLIDQNEKINSKQIVIVKTQNDISHRQSNFARVLAKAKQFFFEHKHPKPKPSASTEIPIDVFAHTGKDPSTPLVDTTESSQNPDYIKINLFSIPSLQRLKNQDKEILKEKETTQSVDDLIYKFYFNNTFIDNLMRHKILSTIVAPENTDSVRSVKNKRTHTHLDTNTLLLPVNDSKPVSGLYYKVSQRKRRSINQHSNRKGKRRYRGKGEPVAVIKEDALGKIVDGKEDKTAGGGVHTVEKRLSAKATKAADLKKSAPFVTMAKSFCNQIGQNQNRQMLSWCVEKALRRLENIETKMPPVPTSLFTRSDLKLSTPAVGGQSPSQRDAPAPGVARPGATAAGRGLTEATVQKKDAASSPAQPAASSLFFPGNDELELNLKQYELTPDTEGNFYYDGSAHASDLGIADEDSASALTPGLESNSQIELDPRALQLQAARRAYMRRHNEEVMRTANQRHRKA